MILKRGEANSDWSYTGFAIESTSATVLQLREQKAISVQSGESFTQSAIGIQFHNSLSFCQIRFGPH